jgi:hypothetical protein
LGSASGLSGSAGGAMSFSLIYEFTFISVMMTIIKEKKNLLVFHEQ